MIKENIMIKVCYVTTISATLNAFVLESAKYIHENTGWDITFVCSDNEEFRKKLPDYIHYFPIKMERGVSLGGVKALFSLIKLFRKQKFDLVQYSTPNAACYASLAAKIVGIPVRLYCQWGIAYVGFEGFKRKVFKTIEKIVCRCSTMIEPDSNSNLNFSISEGLYPASKGRVIWNGSASGVNLQKFDISKKDEYRKNIRKKLGIPSDIFVYGFIGRINRDKGINELFSAMKSILSKNINVYLILVGNPEITKYVDNDLYEWAQKDPHVIFCGYTSVVEQYVAAMDCYVLPSYREGFGLAVVEAEAMGVPVVVTDIPGPIDAMVDEQSGLIVPKKNVDSLESAMLRLYIHPEMRMQMGEFGCRYAKENFEQKQLFDCILSDRKKLLSLH